jgi:hypothetical protein
MIIAIELQGLPKMTNSNSRKHWSHQYREATKWKKAVLMAANENQLIPIEPFAKAKLTLVRFSSSSPDSDGLVSSFKHLIDGLVEAGILANDKFENIGMPDYKWEKCPPKKGKVVIVVEKVA